MASDLRGKTAIAGIGETDYSRNSGRSELMLSLQAISAALDDAGLTAKDVDGLLRWGTDTSQEGEVASALGVPDLAFFGDILQGGNVGAALIAHAAAAIETGLASVVVIYRGLNGRSGRRYGRGEVTGRGGRGLGQFSEPFGMLAPQHGLAMMTRRRMYETGVTSLQFGATAVAIRSHANRNPRATFYDKPLTLEDHQNSRLVVEPLHLFDCCLETDGGGALVVTSAERARDLKQPPAYVRAAAQSGPGAVRSYTDTAAVTTAPRLFRAAGLGPQDVDVVQIYDHFSPYVIFALEDYGFCKRSEGGAFVDSGGITWPDGALPVNTSGGHLSEAYIQGMNQLIEGVRQIRGTSTAQVKDAEVSFVDTGVGTGAVLLDEGDLVSSLPPPIPDEDSQPFWDYCRAGELRAQHCTRCSALRYPPRPICAECGSFDFDWQLLNGRGEVFSYTITHQAIHPALEGLTPHTAILVRLDEGLLLTSNLEDASAPVEIGQRVEVYFERTTDEIALPKFRLVAPSP